MRSAQLLVLAASLAGCSSSEERPPPAACEDPSGCRGLPAAGEADGDRPGETAGARGSSPDSPVASAPCEKVGAAGGAEVGDSFPDLELVTCDNQRVTFDGQRCAADVTLLSIGAGWCEPCREETPALQALHEAVLADGGQVVQVMFEDANAAPATTLFCEQWRDEFDLSLPLFVDPVGRTLAHFDGSLAPFNLVIARDGTVLATETGAILNPEFEAEVWRALGKADAGP